MITSIRAQDTNVSSGCIDGFGFEQCGTQQENGRQAHFYGYMSKYSIFSQIKRKLLVYEDAVLEKGWYFLEDAPQKLLFWGQGCALVA
jgi:hypothetical protein